MSLDQNAIAKIQSYGTSTRKASYTEILNDLNQFGDFITNNPGTEIQNFEKIVSILQRTDDVGNNYKQGVHWMIRDLNTNGDLFKGKKFNFEQSIPNARPTTSNSSIDLFCLNCTPNNLKVEYKSGPNSITSSTIKEQFIERDLFNANSLDEIQWRMESTGFDKDKLKMWLIENRGSIDNIIGGVDISKSAKFKEFFNLDTFDDSVSDIQINNFVDSYFALIFR